MNVKIDTKEKFTVIGLNDPDISANMTAEMGNLLSSFIKNNSAPCFKHGAGEKYQR